MTVPDAFHLPFHPSPQAASSQPLPLELVGDKRSSRSRGGSASQPETRIESKKAKGT